MSVMLLILKITGIVLLAILGVILVLILAACFYPVGYRIRGLREDEIQVKFSLYWLFWIIYLKFEIKNGEKSAILYLFGIPKRLYPAKKQREKKPKKNTPKQQADDEMPASSDDTNQEPPTSVSSDDTNQEPPTSVSIDDTNQAPVPDENWRDAGSQSGIKRGFLSRAFACFGKLKRIAQRIRLFFIQLPGKLKTWYGRADNWKEALTNEANQASVRLILGEMRYLLRHYRPRKLKANIRYGLGDPSVTGKSLAVISMIPLFYKKGVQIVPDFEADQFLVKGDIDAKGFLRLCHLLRSGLHIWNDENSRNFIRKLRQ